MRKTHIARNARGFTLIELGVVVAVIAILATVVLVGRGFLVSTRITKEVEVVTTVCKAAAVYAGTSGSTFPDAAGTDILPKLVTRKLVDAGVLSLTGTVTEFAIVSVEVVTPETYDVKIDCPNASACDDIQSAKDRDTSKVSFPVTGDPLTIRFRL